MIAIGQLPSASLSHSTYTIPRMKQTIFYLLEKFREMRFDIKISFLDDISKQNTEKSAEKKIAQHFCFEFGMNRTQKDGCMQAKQK